MTLMSTTTKPLNQNKMKAQEKAKQIYNKMLHWQADSDIYLQKNIISSKARQCALIAVDEVLSEATDEDDLNWWKLVKLEIELL